MTPSCAPTFLLAFLILATLTHAQTVVFEAVAVLAGPVVNGTVYFRQPSNATVSISGFIQGIPPNVLRGFHIHEFGNLVENCASTGPHYNPFNVTHGGPADAERHVGDLGNIQTDSNGNFSLTDNIISLNGLYSIVGRAVVLHNATDDLGRKSDNGSMTTGNAGARLACGVIGISLVRNISQPADEPNTMY